MVGKQVIVLCLLSRGALLIHIGSLGAFLEREIYKNIMFVVTTDAGWNENRSMLMHTMLLGAPLERKIGQSIMFVVTSDAAWKESFQNNVVSSWKMTNSLTLCKGM